MDNNSINFLNCNTKQRCSLDEINRKRALMEQTDWSDPKYDDIHKRANDNFDDLEQYVYSVIVSQPD